MADDGSGSASFPDAGGGADGNSNSTRIILCLALGRLMRDSTGALAPDKHRLIASTLDKKDDDAKTIKGHLKAVMKKGGEKLTAGKRLRLKNDAGGYDVHILCEALESENGSGGHASGLDDVLLFFVLTVPDFAKYQNIGLLFRDFKLGVYDKCEPDALVRGANVQREVDPVFKRVMQYYGRSELREAENKVDAIKSVMQASVSRALNSVEQLENIDDRSEEYVDHAKKFQKRAVVIKRITRGNYYKLTILLGLVVLGILAYFIVPAIISASTSSKSGTDTTVLYSSSSSTGSANGKSGTEIV